MLISFTNQIWVALKQYKRFPHTFTYLFAYFLLADVRAVFAIYLDDKLTYSGNHDQGLNTTSTLVTICQNEKFTFSFLQSTYLGLAQAVTSTASTLGFWYIQRHWKISTKKMVRLLPSSFPWERSIVKVMGLVCCDKHFYDPDPVMGDGWNLDKQIWVGFQRHLPLRRVDLEIVPRFHNVWEFWAYNVVFGLFQAPYYAFSQTMMAELSPPGFDNMVRTADHPSAACFNKLGETQFFSLFGLSNTSSSMIGRNVIQAIINRSGNNWDGFPFLFILCTSASLVIWFAVDVPKGRRAAVRWAAEQRGTAAGAANSGGADIRASLVSSRET